MSGVPPTSAPPSDYTAWIAWLKAHGTRTYQILALNWERDPHVLTDARKAAGEVCAKCTAPGDVLRGATWEAWAKPFWFKHSLPDPIPAERLSRVMRVKDFAKYNDWNGVLAANNGAVSQLVLDGFTPADCKGKVGGQTICWCCPTTEIADPKFDADMLRDALGLTHYEHESTSLAGTAADPNLLMEVEFSSSVGTLYRPTVVEAGDHAAFLPSDTAAEAGQTAHLRTGRPHTKEFIMEPFSATKHTALRLRGALTTKSPIDWQTVRLNSL